MSLLEALTATTIMATMMTSSVVVLRSSHAAWRAHEDDLERAESANAVLRHLVRHLRQATAVSAVSASSDTSGSLSLTMASGDTYVWDHNSGTGEVLFGPTTATSLLADNIDTLTFYAYEADGSTLTTTAADAQLIRCVATVTMPAGGGSTRTVSCTGWVRSW
ncbi:MAG: hypothetical protein AAGG46_01385 [Planctomycetota bacterium]